MENINSLVLTTGIIALALYSMKVSHDTSVNTLKVSHDTVVAVENMNKSIQMMFVKS